MSYRRTIDKKYQKNKIKSNECKGEKDHLFNYDRNIFYVIQIRDSFIKKSIIYCLKKEFGIQWH
jgi:hypothetical protein